MIYDAFHLFLKNLTLRNDSIQQKWMQIMLRNDLNLYKLISLANELRIILHTNENRKWILLFFLYWFCPWSSHSTHFAKIVSITQCDRQMSQNKCVACVCCLNFIYEFIFECSYVPSPFFDFIWNEIRREIIFPFTDETMTITEMSKVMRAIKRLNTFPCNFKKNICLFISDSYKMFKQKSKQTVCIS